MYLIIYINTIHGRKDIRNYLRKTFISVRQFVKRQTIKTPFLMGGIFLMFKTEKISDSLVRSKRSSFLQNQIKYRTVFLETSAWSFHICGSIFLKRQREYCKFAKVVRKKTFSFKQENHYSGNSRLTLRKQVWETKTLS